MGSLSGKVAIVTGASNGIGRAIAERMADDGAIVVVNYNHSEEKAKEVITGIQAKGGKGLAVQTDMSQVAEVRRLVNETVKQFGRLDILVNNAGKFMPKPLLDTTAADFDQIFALNAKGPYFAMQEAGRVIKEGGRIVNVSTDGTHLNFPGATAYFGRKGRAGTVHERPGTGTRATRHHSQYHLARLYRHGNDDRAISTNRDRDVAIETIGHTQRYRRRRGFRGQ